MGFAYGSGRHLDHRSQRLLGLVTWRLRAATPAAALTGALITASLMFSTVVVPYAPWHTALIPTLAVSLLAFAATRAGRHKKERLGTAEGRKGRSASQVAANLGLAALVSSSPVQSWLMDSRWVPHHAATPTMLFALALAALAEAAADTASSEIGQVLGGRPRMITSFKRSIPARDGAISLAGSLAGVVAAAVVAYAGMWALGGGWSPVCGELRGRRLRPLLRQPAGSNAGGTRLAEQRRGEFSVDGQRGGVCAVRCCARCD